VVQWFLGGIRRRRFEGGSERFEVFSKVHRFLDDLRQRSRNLGLLRSIEGFATNRSKARRRGHPRLNNRLRHEAGVASPCQGQLAAGATLASWERTAPAVPIQGRETAL